MIKNRKFSYFAPVLSLLVCLLFSALSLGSCRSNDDDNGVTKVGYSETQKDNLWVASYDRLDGRLEKTFKASAKRTLVIEFETESGEMDLLVYEKDSGNAVDVDGMQMQYKCVGNGSYEIPISEDVVVRLDARDHDGRFSMELKK